MRKPVFLASVRHDLLEILTSVAEESGSVAIAQGFVSQLRSRCRALAALPGVLGRGRPESPHDIRSSAYKGT